MIIFFFSLAAEYSETHNWIFFCEEDTRIDLKKFIKAKKQFDPQKVSTYLLIN